jgi:hypothetical protein
MGSEVDFRGFHPTSMGWAKGATCSALLRLEPSTIIAINSYGVGKGARTLNHLIHSQVLCQLSYAHHTKVLGHLASGLIISEYN